MGCVDLRMRKIQEQAEKKQFNLLLHLFLFFLLTGETAGSADEESLTRGLLHGFLPAVIADPGAQSQHGVHMAAFPMHARAFEPCLDDAGVGTLDASTAKRPSLVLKEGIAHQLFAFLQVMHLGRQILHLRMVFEQPAHVC